MKCLWKNCGNQATELILGGCLNLHCWEYAYCLQCTTTQIMPDRNIACRICALRIDLKYHIKLPAGHTPLGPFNDAR